MDKKILTLASALTFVSLFSINAYADMDLETDNAVSGMAVALNNYKASSVTPGKALGESLKAATTKTIEISGVDDARTKLVDEVVKYEAPTVQDQLKDNIAVSNTGESTMIHVSADDDGEVVGRISPSSVATVLETVVNENGEWYKISSGNVDGYVKTAEITTGDEAKIIAKESATTYGTVVDIDNVRLRTEPKVTSDTLTMLEEGEKYVVVGRDDDFVKVQVDDDLVGYVYKDFLKTDTSYKTAKSNDEIMVESFEREKLAKEADEAINNYNDLKSAVVVDSDVDNRVFREDAVVVSDKLPDEKTEETVKPRETEKDDVKSVVEIGSVETAKETAKSESGIKAEETKILSKESLTETVKSKETTKPKETAKTKETAKSEETTKTTATTEMEETTKAKETVKPEETTKTTEKPAETPFAVATEAPNPMESETVETAVPKEPVAAANKAEPETAKKEPETTKMVEETTKKPEETTKKLEETSPASDKNSVEGTRAYGPGAEEKEENSKAIKAPEKKTEGGAVVTGENGGPGVSGLKAVKETTKAALEKASRSAVVAYAKQFVGNPYVFGGTSLTEGADCSGFTMKVYEHFGISTGRNSKQQANNGKEISVSDIQPGDLLFYSSSDTINHVGIYIGDGKIVHASNAKTGIIISSQNYRTPVKAVTFLK